jgi:hypothetical protein
LGGTRDRLVVSYIIIVDNIDESLPFLVEELKVTMHKMLMGHRKNPSHMVVGNKDGQTA